MCSGCPYVQGIFRLQWIFRGAAFNACGWSVAGASGADTEGETVVEAPAVVSPIELDRGKVAGDFRL